MFLFCGYIKPGSGSIPPISSMLANASGNPPKYMCDQVHNVAAGNMFCNASDDQKMAFCEKIVILILNHSIQVIALVCERNAIRVIFAFSAKSALMCWSCGPYPDPFDKHTIN